MNVGKQYEAYHIDSNLQLTVGPDIRTLMFRSLTGMEPSYNNENHAACQIE